METDTDPVTVPKMPYFQDPNMQISNSCERCAVDIQPCVGVLTNGAVFTRPALMAVTLALSADSVVDAAWVTVPLLTFWSCPAFFALTHTANAGPVGTAVHHAYLCCQRKARETCHFCEVLLYSFCTAVALYCGDASTSAAHSCM